VNQDLQVDIFLVVAVEDMLLTLYQYLHQQDHKVD
jgi:hypothetical protein